MKSVLSVLASLFVGVLLADTNFAPMFELQRLARNRRRVLLSLALGATAFALTLAAVILLAIDLVVQYEDKGYIVWNAIVTLTACLAVAALICIWAARRAMPSPKDVLLGWSLRHPAEFFNQVLRHFAPNASPSAPAPTTTGTTT